ncbi:MAG: 1-acyl-sn-glycerol-3-phosphate acyltransferase, partial [bacterium]|nr:1-acyl-sn-glycerol-3-phosphate acyltransferase [bacterium]
HVLKPIYQDANKTVKQNSKDMAETDYNQKKECYEKVYHKKLTYDFSYDDIAGLKKEVMK